MTTGIPRITENKYVIERCRQIPQDCAPYDMQGLKRRRWQAFVYAAMLVELRLHFPPTEIPGRRWVAVTHRLHPNSIRSTTKTEIPGLDATPSKKSFVMTMSIDFDEEIDLPERKSHT